MAAAEDSTSVKDYDVIISGPLANFLTASASIGDLVEKQVLLCLCVSNSIVVVGCIVAGRSIDININICTH